MRNAARREAVFELPRPVLPCPSCILFGLVVHKHFNERHGSDDALEMLASSIGPRLPNLDLIAFVIHRLLQSFLVAHVAIADGFPELGDLRRVACLLCRFLPACLQLVERGGERQSAGIDLRGKVFRSREKVASLFDRVVARPETSREVANR